MCTRVHWCALVSTHVRRCARGCHFSEYTISALEQFSDNQFIALCCPLANLANGRSGNCKRVKEFDIANGDCALNHLDGALGGIHSSDTNVPRNKFKNVCPFCINNSVPYKMKRIGRSNPLTNRSIIHLQCKINRLKRKKSVTVSIPQIKRALSIEVYRAKDFYHSNLLPNFLPDDPENFSKHFSDANDSINKIMHDGDIFTVRCK